MKRRVGLLAILLSVQAAAMEQVTIGAEDDWYPYSGLVNGQIKGMTIDLVSAAYQAVGVTVNYEVMPYARCMALTRAGARVGCFDTLRHPGIENDYRWHAQPMFSVQYQIYARASSTEHNLRPADLEGRTVAVTNSYEYGPEFDTNTRIKRVLTPRDESNFRMLIAGRVDYTLAMDYNTRNLIRKQPAVFAGKFKIVGQVAEAGVYTVFSKQHPQAMRAMKLFDEGMAKIRKNGRYDAIRADWKKRMSTPD